MTWLYIVLALIVVSVLAMVVDEVLYARKVKRLKQSLADEAAAWRDATETLRGGGR